MKMAVMGLSLDLLAITKRITTVLIKAACTGFSVDWNIQFEVAKRFWIPQYLLILYETF